MKPPFRDTFDTNNEEDIFGFTASLGFETG